MFEEDRNDVVRKAYREFSVAKQALATLEAAIEELSQSSSIGTKEGSLMLSPAGIRLVNTDYAREVVAQYRAAERNKETLRKRIVDLGEPDPE